MYQNIIAFPGSEDYAQELLRAAVSCELYLNTQYYSNHPILQKVGQEITYSESTLFALMLPDETSALFDGSEASKVTAIKTESLANCDRKRWSSLIHICAVASVLKTTIWSTYPLQNANIRQLLNGPVTPRVKPDAQQSENTKVHVLLWSRDGALDDRKGSIYVPNHFVPLFVQRNMQLTPYLRHSELLEEALKNETQSSHALTEVRNNNNELHRNGNVQDEMEPKMVNFFTVFVVVKIHPLCSRKISEMASTVFTCDFYSYKVIAFQNNHCVCD